MIWRATGFLAVTLLFFFSGISFAKDKLIFGSTPWKGAEDLAIMHAPLMQYLEATLGVETVLVASRNYEELIEMLVQRQIDVGMFSSGAYVKATHKLAGMKYIASAKKENTDGELKSNYRGIIIVLKKSGIENLSDLHGKHFGFTDAQSSSGYIFPIRMLSDAGIDPKSYFSNIFFLGKHDKVIKALLAGSIDAGATFEDMYTLATREHGEIFQVIATTPEIPFDAYAAGPHVTDETVRAIQSALQVYVAPPSADANAKGGPAGFDIRSDDYYNFVRSALNP